MYKVLALDLDGTVLADDHRIHPEVKQAIIEAKKRWHVVLVTGRHHTAAKPYYLELELDSPIICCNGTYTYDYKNEKVLSHNALNKEICLSFIEKAMQNQLKLVMYITHAMTYLKTDPIEYIVKLEHWAKSILPEARPQIYPIDSFESAVLDSQHIWKFVIEGEPNCVEHFLHDSWILENFSAERSWFNRIDFAAIGNSKGKSLAQYVEKLGYLASQVIAAGDNHNDISMLNFAGIGIAMNNADKAVKESAQLICPTDSNQDGLAQIIRELGKQND